MTIPDRFGVRRYRQDSTGRLIPDPNGLDTSGRPLFLSNDTKSRMDNIRDELGWLPTITQGEYMARAGGGAADSAGFHDKRGCVDFRTWDRTTSQMDDFIHVASKYGAQGWRRDAAHGGMDPHCHWVTCGPNNDMSAGAISQEGAVAAGLDGLSPPGPDYERKHRKLPLVLDYDYAKEEREDMAELPENYWERLNNIEDRNTQKILAALGVQSKGTRAALRALRSEINEMGKEIDNLPAEQKQAIRESFGPRLRSIEEKLDQLAADEPDTEEV